MCNNNNNNNEEIENWKWKTYRHCRCRQRKLINLEEKEGKNKIRKSTKCIHRMQCSMCKFYSFIENKESRQITSLIETKFEFNSEREIHVLLYLFACNLFSVVQCFSVPMVRFVVLFLALLSFTPFTVWFVVILFLLIQFTNGVYDLLKLYEHTDHIWLCAMSIFYCRSCTIQC